MLWISADLDRFSRFKNTKYLYDELEETALASSSLPVFKKWAKCEPAEDKAVFPDLGQALKNPFFFRDLQACPAPGPMAWWFPPHCLSRPSVPGMGPGLQEGYRPVSLWEQLISSFGKSQGEDENLNVKRSVVFGERSEF